MSLSKEIEFKSFMPPGLTTIGGKTYVIPGWHEVPEQTTLKEVKERWTQVLPKGEAKPNYVISEEVLSSKKDKTYEVSFDGKFWKCSCVGFGFRRSCSHINAVKEKHKIK